MPELAEVKIYARNLDKLVGGKQIESLRSYAGGDFDYLAGRTVEKVTSYGKGIYFELRGGGNLYVHLMLTGGFAYVGKDEYASVKGKMLALKTEGNYLIVFDENRYARLEKNRPAENVPEACGNGFTLGYFMSLSDSRAAVKNMLTNQALILGIGNAYADEILYAAKISPFSPVNKIPTERLKALYAAVFDVFDYAEKYLERHFPNMLSGEYREFFKVHIKGAKTTEEGEEIKIKTAAGRKTYYTESQILY